MSYRKVKVKVEVWEKMGTFASLLSASESESGYMWEEMGLYVSP